MKQARHEHRKATRKKILLVIDEATIGGGQQHVLLVARHLDGNRFEAAVACEGRGPLVDELRRASVPVYAVHLTNFPSPRAVRRLASIMRDFRPDIVHTHGGTAGFAGRIAGRIRGCRVVHTYHAIHYLHAAFPKKFLLTAVDRLLARITHRLICVAQRDYDAGLHAGVVDPRKTVVIRNGIEIEAFGRIARSRARRDKEERVPVIGTVGRLHAQKGHRHLIDAARILRERGRSFKVDVIGEGDLRSELEAMVHDAGLEGIVRLQGSRTDIGSCLARFDIFVLPSLWEGLPLALLEAMAAGVPVVASAVDGVPEVVEDGVNGILVPRGDAGALAGALERLLDNPGEGRVLAAAAEGTIRERFGVRTMMDSLQRLYAEAAQ